MKKTVCKIKIFNDFQLNSCFKHQLLTAFKSLNLDLRFYFSNFIYSYKTKNNLLQAYPLLFKSYSKKYKQMGVNIRHYKKVKDIISDLKRKLTKNYIIILSCDCYGLSYRDDMFLKYHGIHYILLYGFDDKRKIFYGVDHDYKSSYEYKKKNISYEDVVNSSIEYQKNYSATNNTLYYCIKKTNTHNQYELNTFIQDIISNKKKLQNGYKALCGFFKKLRKVLLDYNTFSKYSSSIERMILQIKQNKEIEKYQLHYLFKKKNLDRLMDLLIHDYTYIFAIIVKYNYSYKYNLNSMKNCVDKMINIRKYERKLIETIYENIRFK